MKPIIEYWKWFSGYKIYVEDSELIKRFSQSAKSKNSEVKGGASYHDLNTNKTTFDYIISAEKLEALMQDRTVVMQKVKSL